jgi:hypothetical protein
MPLDDGKISPLEGSDDENLKMSRDANTKGDTDGNGDDNGDEYNDDENLKRQQQENEDDDDDGDDDDENFKQQQQEEKDDEDNDDDDEDNEDDVDIINDKYDEEYDENDDEDEEDDEDDDEEDNDNDGQGKLCINKDKILGMVKFFVFENEKKRATSAHDSSPKEGTIHENEPSVKKRKLQREQIVIGLNDTSDKSRDISRWKNVVMTPSVKKIFEEDLKTWTPSFAFMVSSIDNY